MKHRFFGLISASLAIASVVACSSSSSSNVGADGGGVAADACTTYANALIANSNKCDGSLDPSQTSALATRYAKQCNAQLALPGVASGTSAALSACAAAVQAADCNTDISQVDACNGISSTGTLADGATCSIGIQCTSGSCNAGATSSDGDAGAATDPNCGQCVPAVADGGDCLSSGTCVTGDTCVIGSDASGNFTATCTPKTAPGDIGAKCQSGSDCKAPDHCDDSSACAAPAASGAACEGTTDCATGLICVAGTGSDSGNKCQAPVALGGACTGGDCVVGAACDTASNVCAKVTFAAPGAACDGLVTLCSKGRCNSEASGTAPAPNTCPSIIPDGAACDSSDASSSCDDLADCTNGTCVFIPNACK